MSYGSVGAVQRALIVEDSAAMRAFVRATLESDGITDIAEATSGLDALRLLPRGGFTLMVVDLNMPGMTGLELIAFLRKNATYRSVPIVVASTEARASDRDKALALGASAYVTKPFTPEALLAVVRAVQRG